MPDSLALQLAAIKRGISTADLLQQQANQPIQFDQRGSIGITQGLAKLAQAFIAGRARNSADTKLNDFITAQRTRDEATKKANADLFNALQNQQKPTAEQFSAAGKPVQTAVLSGTIAQQAARAKLKQPKFKSVNIKTPGKKIRVGRINPVDGLPEIRQKDGSFVAAPVGSQIVSTNVTGTPDQLGFGGTKTQIGKQKIDLQNSEIATRQALATAKDMKAAVLKDPKILGLSGAFERNLTGFVTQAKNFSELSGIKISASLDPSKYSFDKAGIGAQNAVFKANVVKLAFAAASAAGQTARSVSDKDVQRFIDEIGGSLQDPKQFAAVIDNFTSGLERDFRIRFSVINKTPFTGNLNPVDKQITQQPVQVKDVNEALALPKGTVFITPDGRQKVR